MGDGECVMEGKLDIQVSPSPIPYRGHGISSSFRSASPESLGLRQS